MTRTAPDTLMGEAAQAPMARGFAALARALAVTLGPSGRLVVGASLRGPLPELLSDSATIARRFVALPDRAESAGAMLLRSLVWRQHQRCGDGCATAAVVAAATLRAARRMAAAGVDAAALRAGMQRACDMAAAALERAARPVASEEELLRVARGVCQDERLAEVASELFEVLGADGHVAVEEYAAPLIEREYVEGGRWKGRLASPYFAAGPGGESPLWPPRAVLRGARVALFAGRVEAAEDVLPLLDAAAAGDRPLLLIAQDVAGPALAALVLNHQRGRVRAAAAELRELGDMRRRDFEDLAALTGARLLAEDAGERLRAIDADALGSARRAELSESAVVISGRRSAPAARAQVERLRAQLDALAEAPDDERAPLRARLGRLTGGTALLKVGAASDAERDLRRRQADQAVRALPLALRGGVLPGGGSALAHVASEVEAAAPAGDLRYGALAVAEGLRAPLLQIVANAGRADPPAVLAEVRRAGPGWGYDAERDEVADLAAIGVLDAAPVLVEALRAAVSGAAMAVTTDALVLPRTPQQSFEP